MASTETLEATDNTAVAPKNPFTAATADTAAPQPQAVVEYGRRRLIIVVGIMMAALLQTLDSTIVNVALPTIEGNIGASIDEGTWIITGYIISNVIAIPLAPYLLQLLGRRQYYAMSIAGFTIASILCGTATTLPLLVFFRIVQGVFGGGLIATSQIILRDTFPPDKLGASSGLFAIALVAGPALGPVLGGVLTDQLSWQWVFEINLIPGAIATVIILTMLKNSVAPKKLPFDAIGLGLLAVGLGSFQYVLDEGERNDWFGNPTIVTFAVAAFVGLASFIFWELYGTSRPIVYLRIFKLRNVVIGFLAGLLLGMVNFGPTVLMPQYLQTTINFTATLSGWLMLMRATPVVVITPFAADIASKIDPRVLIVTGTVISAVSFLLIGGRMTTGSDFGTFSALFILSGIGQALAFVPLLVGVLSSVPRDRAPTASSFISLAFNLGASIASTLLVTIFDRRSYFHSDVYRSSITIDNPLISHQALTPQNLAGVAQLVAREAANAGFADAIYALVPVSIVALIVVLFLAHRVAGRASKIIISE